MPAPRSFYSSMVISVAGPILMTVTHAVGHERCECFQEKCLDRDGETTHCVNHDFTASLSISYSYGSVARAYRAPRQFVVSA